MFKPILTGLVCASALVAILGQASHAFGSEPAHVVNLPPIVITGRL